MRFSTILPPGHGPPKRQAELVGPALVSTGGGRVEAREIAGRVLWEQSGIVLARMAESVVVYVPEGDGARLERVDVGDGKRRLLGRFEHGMRYVRPHAIVRDGRLVFATDDRILWAIDLSSGAVVMREEVRADRLFRIVSLGERDYATYAIDTADGYCTLIAPILLDEGRLAAPELEIYGLARDVSAHAFASGERALVLRAEAAVKRTLTRALFTAVWEVGGVPLVIAGAHEVASREGTLTLTSQEARWNVTKGELRGFETSMQPFMRDREWLLPPLPYGSVARRLPEGGRLAEPGPRRRSTFLLPERRTRWERLGHSILDALFELERRHGFVGSALMADVFSLSLESMAFAWRLGSLGLKLHDPTLAHWVVPGSDPSLVTFGELARPDGESHMLAFYMYPARGGEQPPIVYVGRASLRVEWAADDFDEFFRRLLIASEARLPSTVDTILALLGRDPGPLDPQPVIGEPPTWFSLVHGVEPAARSELELARQGRDLLRLERLLVKALTDARSPELEAISSELRVVYKELDWMEHDAAVRRWATAASR